MATYCNFISCQILGLVPGMCEDIVNPTSYLQTYPSGVSFIIPSGVVTYAWRTALVNHVAVGTGANAPSSFIKSRQGGYGPGQLSIQVSNNTTNLRIGNANQSTAKDGNQSLQSLHQ